MKKYLKHFIVCIITYCTLLGAITLPPVEAASEKSTMTMYTTTCVNVRQKATTKSKIIDTFKKGTKVKVIKRGNKWHAILVGGKKYYMRNKYLSYNKPKQSLKKSRTVYKTSTKKSSLSSAKYSAKYFKQMGILSWGNWKWTWYSQRILPGKGLKIPGRHVGPDGYIMDKNGRICVASSVLPKGTIIKTPFGAEGCVYDCGCAKNIIDIYVDW